MSWILVMSLFSNTSGNYIREFQTEQQCVSEMNKVIRKTEGRNSKNSEENNIKYIGCIANAVAINEEE